MVSTIKQSVVVVRQEESLIQQKLSDSKAIIVLGPRQSGKSTLLRNLLSSTEKVLWLDSDDADTKQLFETPNESKLRAIIGGNTTVVIDEAQRILDIGVAIKIIVDKLKVKVIATGSSSIELANRVHEPLTGRKWEYHLLPLSFNEMVAHHGVQEERRLLKQRLTFGYYPEVVVNEVYAKDVLKEIARSYLYKDILTWEKIKHADRLEKLVQALALQIGNEVSYNELSRLIGISHETVEKYVGLLEQAFIIYRLQSLSRNHRTELRKSRKIYFYDIGLRNAVLNNFSDPEMRPDKGALWENFVVNELLKDSLYKGESPNRFFWRTTDQSEIDYIEERDGILNAYEIKWSGKVRKKIPRAFDEAYPNNSFTIVNFENFGSKHFE